MCFEDPAREGAGGEARRLRHVMLVRLPVIGWGVLECFLAVFLQDQQCVEDPGREHTGGCSRPVVPDDAPDVFWSGF